MILQSARKKYGKLLQTKVQLLNRVENIVEEGEIAHYEPFLLFPQCFQKSSAVNVLLKSVYMWERVN